MQKKTAEKMCDQMSIRLGKFVYLSNYDPSGLQFGAMRADGNGYELNLYNKVVGGRGFKMNTQILEFQDVAFAGFQLVQ